MLTKQDIIAIIETIEGEGSQIENIRVMGFSVTVIPIKNYRYWYNSDEVGHAKHYGSYADVTAPTGEQFTVTHRKEWVRFFDANW